MAAPAAGDSVGVLENARDSVGVLENVENENDRDSVGVLEGGWVSSKTVGVLEREARAAPQTGCSYRVAKRRFAASGIKAPA